MSEKLSSFAQSILELKYAQTKPDGTLESWGDVAHRVATAIVGPVLGEEESVRIEEIIRDRKFIPGGRYLYAAGRPFQAVNNCLLLRAEDSREGWAKLMHDAVSALMSGAGIGVNYSAIRPRGARVGGLGGICTGPVALMEAVNETARQIQAGGSRRSAVYASLAWWHPDALEFIRLKDWTPEIAALKAADYNARAPMDMTNISISLDDLFFDIMDGLVEEQVVTIGGDGYLVDREVAERVYAAVVQSMLTTGEPGLQIDVGEDSGEDLRNACTEVTSRNHNDICNLGSINMSKIDDLDDMVEVTKLATWFLFCGTITGEVPNAEVKAIRDRDRRLGLGLMGMYEWLVARGKRYGEDEELAEWLGVYRSVSDGAARAIADELGLPAPIKVRAIAPAGTISILGETTSGIEPLFAAAYKRRYLKGSTWHYQSVVDAGAERLREKYDVHPDKLETAYDLAYEPGRRIAFQAFVQSFVDQGISSTLNLPTVTEHAIDPAAFGETLYEYLPELRGITAYPDGARQGQPLTVMSYEDAKASEGIEFEEFSAEAGCVSGVCGI